MNSRQSSQPPSRLPSRQPSIRSQHRRSDAVPPPAILNDHLYSHLRDHEAPPPASTEYPPVKYSELGPRGETPPPRPPKPPQLRASSQPPETVCPAPPPSEHRPFSLIYSDDIIAPAPLLPLDPPPPTNIYNTLETDPSLQPLPQPSHYYHILETPGPAPQGEGPLPNGPSELVNGEAGKNLFDDPEYSPLHLARAGRVRAEGKEGKGGGVEVVDPRYAGDYERAPTYQLPTLTVSTSNIDPKYLGDYERDPTYIPPPPPHVQPEGARPPQPPRRRQSLGAVDALKYSGDYERDPAYLPPPRRRHSTKDKELVELKGGRGRGRSREGDKELVHLCGLQRSVSCGESEGRRVMGGGGRLPMPLAAKYQGDYERDPAYLAWLQGGGADPGLGVDYSYPHFDPEQLVPPHLASEYTTLEPALRDPPQQYARLTSDPPETTIVSITTTV